MKSRFLHCLYIWGATLSVSLSPLHAQYSIKHFTIKDGLSQGSNYYFLEDSRGYLWTTSQNGLNRLEGTHFRTYAHADNDPGSIGKGEVRGLVEAPNGDLWVGTEVCLSRYVRQTNRFKNYYLRDGQGKRLFSQTRTFHADDSTVWFLNSERGVVRYNYGRNQLQTVVADVSYAYVSITREVILDKASKHLWLRLPKGLLRYDLKTGQRQYFLTPRPDDTIGKERIIYALHQSRDGAVWMSTDKGIGRIDERGFKEFDIGIDTQDDVVYTFAQTPDGLLWIGTSRIGILVMDPGSGRIVQRFQRVQTQTNALNDNHISELYVDKRGWIWVNVDPKGVDLLFPSVLKPTLYDDNLLDSTDFNQHGVRGIVQDNDGHLWVGTVAEGLRQIDIRTSQIRRYDNRHGLTNYALRSLFCSSTGQVYAGTNGGLGIWDAPRNRFNMIRIPARADPLKANVIRNILEVNSRLFLLATSAGFYTLDHQHTVRFLLDSTSAFSGALLLDQENGLLFAGRRDRDLQCYSVRGTLFSHLYNVLPGYSPTCLRKQGQWLWVGTDNGLIKFNIRSRQVVRHYTTQHGLPDNSIFSLLPDGAGNLWITSNRGMAYMNPSERFTQIPETLNTEFTSNAAYQTDADHLYFGSTVGLYQVQPSRIRARPAPRLRLVDLRVNNLPTDGLTQSIDEVDSLRLPHDQNNISIQAAALDYLSGVPTRYQYRLLGQNEEWIDNSENSLIRYTNLAPGWYELQVKALAATGQWTRAKTLTLYVDSPFWHRWWFMLLVGLAITGLVYGLLRWYLDRKQQAQQRLTSQLMAAQESERQRIAQDLHDDVGNTLAAAKGMLAQAGRAGESAEVSKAQALVEKAGQDLRAISHNLMPVEFETYALPYVVEQSVDKAREASGIRFDFVCVGEQQAIAPERALVLYRVIVELLTNIQKHSRAASATVQLLYQLEYLMITIEDDGGGFQTINKAEPGAGIGLKNITSRANYLSARLEVSTNKQGTLVILEVPYG